MEQGCCVVVCDQSLDATYWDNQWQSKTTGWDIGIASPPLTNFIDSIEDKNLAILIPGCGSAYEAEYLIEKGFNNITLIDISETACDILRTKFKHQPSIQILAYDFFVLDRKYDIILEQTFFCALPPNMRQRYLWKTHQLLNKNGILVGLLFNRTFEVSPPFGGSEDEYKKLFVMSFDLEMLEMAKNSIPPRAGTELFFRFRKRDNVVVNLYSFEGITCRGCKNTVTDIYSKLEGVLNVSMSSDFREVCIVSDKEIDLGKLQEAISYEEHYKISSHE